MEPTTNFVKTKAIETATNSVNTYRIGGQRTHTSKSVSRHVIGVFKHVMSVLMYVLILHNQKNALVV